MKRKEDETKKIVVLVENSYLRSAVDCFFTLRRKLFQKNSSDKSKNEMLVWVLNNFLLVGN